MINNSKNELFFSLSGDQISICLFNSKNGILKKCSNFQFPDRFENDLNFNVIINSAFSSTLDFLAIGFIKTNAITNKNTKPTSVLNNKSMKATCDP